MEVFTIGIMHGNTLELNDMASEPKEEHAYLLESFAEFEALARRALHEGQSRSRSFKREIHVELGRKRLGTGQGITVTSGFE